MKYRNILFFLAFMTSHVSAAIVYTNVDMHLGGYTVYPASDPGAHACVLEQAPAYCFDQWINTTISVEPGELTFNYSDNIKEQNSSLTGSGFTSQASLAGYDNLVDSALTENTFDVTFFVESKMDYLLSGSLTMGWDIGNPVLEIWDNSTLIYNLGPNFNGPSAYTLNALHAGTFLEGHSYRILMDMSYIQEFNPGLDAWDIQLTTVPVPAAVWLFGSGLVGLIGVARRKKA